VKPLLPFAIVLMLACRQEPSSVTATIAPAEPRPSPPPADMTVGDVRVLSTQGSPAPPVAVAPGSEVVTIDAEGFVVRPLLPRAHTAFRVVNQTADGHDVVIRGASGSVRGHVPKGGRVILQLGLRDEAYELVCTSPGHGERARFTTYRAGVPFPAAK
jgi:hypothetical protein